MNLDIDQEQSDQSRRCEGATMAKHNCWDHACTRETNETTHDPLPALAESCLSKISSLCTDAPGRMEAAVIEHHAKAIGAGELMCGIMEHSAFRAIPPKYRGPLLEAMEEVRASLRL